MDENIIIPIQIDKSGGLSELKKFGSEARNAIGAIGPGARLGEINIDVRMRNGGAPTELRNIGTAAAQAGNGLKNIQPGANAANYALLNLNRVVQDSPYGIMGITNNINPLLESFQRLKKESGSTGGALKALAGSLIGGGGLGLAVAAISAALTFGSIGLDMWHRGSKKAKEATSELANSQKEFDDIIKQSNATAAQQIGALKQVSAVAGDVTISTKRRKDALKDLQDLYPSYLKNVSLDDATNGKLATTIQTRLIPAIIAAAKARAYQEQINKLTTDGIKLEENQTKVVGEHIKNVNTLNEKRDYAKKFKGFSGGVGSTGGWEGVARDLSNAEGKAQLSSKAWDYNTAAIKRNEAQIVSLTNKMMVATKMSGNIGIDGRDIASGNKKVKDALSDSNTEAKKLIEYQKELGKDLGYLENQLDKGLITPLEFAKQKLDLLTKAGKDFQTQFNQPADGALIKGIDEQARKLQATLLRFELKELGPSAIAPTTKTIKQKVDVVPKIDPLAYFKRIESEQNKLKALGVERVFKDGIMLPVALVVDEQSLIASRQMAETQIAAFRDTIKNAAVDGLAGIGEGLGDALSGVEGLGGIFNRVGTVLGGAMKAFGKEMIQSGVTMIIAKKAMKALLSNPYTAIAAGIALVAVGTALSNKLNKKSNQPVGGFADGGVAYGPMLAWVGESPRTSRSNPEMFARFDQFKALVGAEIKGALSNGQVAMGNRQSTAVLEGDVRFEIQGDKLVGVLTRTQQRQGRNF